MRAKTASLDELVEVFDVSKNTIRRDVQALVEQGQLRKVYGGVAANDGMLLPFIDRQTRSQTEKKSIARLASAFIEDGDVIFVDSGTTTTELLSYIQAKQLTVITNNFGFITNARSFENLQIISTGGELDRNTNSFVSLGSNDILQTYNINKAFMASTGISISRGVTNASPLETPLKTTAVNMSSQVYLLVDHDKFETHGLKTYCSLSDVDCIVTNSEPPHEFKDYAQSHNIQILFP